MDPHWTSENWGPRQYGCIQPYEFGNNLQRFSSPISESPDALHVYPESPGLGANIDHSPSPSMSAAARHAHPPSPLSVRHYNQRHGPSYGVPTVYPNLHAHANRSGFHHPTTLDQNHAQILHSASSGISEHYVATSDENSAQCSFGWRLRPVSELPDRFRGVFKFGVFNAIQSACFDQVLHSEENLVISAPTGSGKTVLFELSIIRVLTQTGGDARTAKCVYVAPTKALCAEKYNEWTAKFGGLGVKCCELTGDTLLLGRGVWGDAKNSHIIVTTAEKWDSLTRSWTDHSRILSQIRLFLVDEVHVLNESRGSTLEVVVSRMKARGSDIRFLLISATVPNVEDVACWIGRGDGSIQSAKIFQFGEEFRPCKLKKFVYGVVKPKGQNDFAYARTLDLRLFHVIQQHSTNKPILVFCPTRKGTLDTAKQLAKDYEQAMKGKQSLPWSPPPHIHHRFHDKDLTALASVGIAVHHAGLSTDDRRMVEELYSQKALRVLVSTSTLAVGVNLPAQMVVIKGVKLYQNGEMKEYSDLDVMQMMGRAGRPQFDNEGIAIILCEPELEHKYRALSQGTTTLESSLHQNLAEHINSEIGLCTISNVNGARDWLRNSFLFRRIQKNPRHYDIGKHEEQTWEGKIDEIVMQSILSLRDTQLIVHDETDGKLSSTEYGDVMSKFYIRQATMRAILNLPPSSTMREILELVSVSEEVSDLKLRNGEKQTYEKIRRHNDIRFPPKKVVNTSDKVFLLIQAILAGLPLNNPDFKPSEGQPYLEAVSLFRHATRIVTAVAEVAVINRSGAQLKHALELVRCLNAKAWEDRPLVLRQIEHIGEKSVKVLAENGITSIQKLLHTSPLRIEELLNRRPPFGHEVLGAANEFPKYYLDIKELRSIHSDENSPVEVEFNVQCGLAFCDSAPQRVKKSKWGKTEMTTILSLTSDMVFIDFRRIATAALNEKREFTLTAQLTKPSQAINVFITSERFAGVTVVQTLAPSVPPDKYPTLETRPLTSIEMDLQGLENVPDFWDMGLDDDDESTNSHVFDLTKSRGASKVQQPPLDLSVNQRVEPDPKLRHDGKYECNHTCKDKLKCRHYCCQEGLLVPPRASKKKGVNASDSDAKPVPPVQNPIVPSSFQDVQKRETGASTEDRIKTTKRKHSTKPQSDKVQKKANASCNPRPVKPSGPQKSQGKKPPPNFDLKLATLKRSRSSTSVDSIPTDDCWDALPIISDARGKDNIISKPGSLKADGREDLASKRSRTEVIANSLGGSRPLRKMATPRGSKTQPFIKSSTQRLFIPGSDDERIMDRCDNHSATRNSTFHLDASFADTAFDSAVGQIPEDDGKSIQPASSQWSGDGASTNTTLLYGDHDATTLRDAQSPVQSTLPRNDSYVLSPSRITGFIRRRWPHVQEPSTMNDFSGGSLALAFRRFDGDISSGPVDSNGSKDTSIDDPLAEFDRWVASGAVQIIPD